MSNSKNYNSIVFLTTLSVYLGLVLVGATPPVLAHAALTQKIEIQNEIETEDDLDKKPENDELAKDIEIIGNYKLAEAITNFIEDIKKLESIGKFNPKEDWVFSHKIWLEEFDTTNSISKNSDISNPWLETAIEQMVSTAEPDFSSTVSEILPHCNGKNCRETSIEIKSTANEFSLSFKFTKQTTEKAKTAADAFNKFFVTRKVASKNTSDLPIYENTKAHAENNQVFIITRLPRSSIDELLAEKVAK